MSDAISGLVQRLSEAKSSRIIQLVTIGRQSGLPRTVTVGFICHYGRLYVRTSHRTNWYKNILANPEIKVIHDGAEFLVRAKQVKNEEISKVLQHIYWEKYNIFDVYARLIKLRGDLHFFEITGSTKDACK